MAKVASDPDGVIKWTIHCSINGNKFLNEKLEQLRSIDSFGNKGRWYVVCIANGEQEHH
ncbi:MAG: hypothetical protein WB988_01515 [Candidatus Nitrosopolaris sp.]|jgi:hypothetical protein